MLVTSGTDSFQNETTAGRVIWEWRTREAIPQEGGHTLSSGRGRVPLGTPAPRDVMLKVYRGHHRSPRPSL